MDNRAANCRMKCGQRPRANWTTPWWPRPIDTKDWIMWGLRASMYSILFLMGGVLSASAAEDMSEVEFVPHFIRIHESGSSFWKTWHEMDSKEFSAAVTAICTVFYDCGGLDAVGLAAVHGTQGIVSGGDFSTSGVIHKHAGEEWWIAFPPPGYTTCGAAYDSKTISANKGDATSGTIFRGSRGDWLGSYDEVPMHRKEGHWVSVNFVVKYVKAGTEQNHNCVPDGTPVWNVH